jgi:predicted RNase H-like nuclease (RuvC/YqgF family)
MKTNIITFGVDIVSYKEKSKTKSKVYSLVILSDNHIEKHDKLNNRNLLRKIRDIKPDYIAIDNIFELIIFSSLLQTLKASLDSLIQFLPLHCLFRLQVIQELVWKNSHI